MGSRQDLQVCPEVGAGSLRGKPRGVCGGLRRRVPRDSLREEDPLRRLQRIHRVRMDGDGECRPQPIKRAGLNLLNIRPATSRELSVMDFWLTQE